MAVSQAVADAAGNTAEVQAISAQNLAARSPGVPTSSTSTSAPKASPTPEKINAPTMPVYPGPQVNVPFKEGTGTEVQGQQGSGFNQRVEPQNIPPPPTQPVPTQVTTSPVTSQLPPPDIIASGEQAANAALSDYQKSIDENLKPALKAEQDALVANANDKYSTQKEIFDRMEALQTDLAAKKDAIISSGADLQKKEAQDAFDSNSRALELQRQKVKDSYDSMQEEQQLLNTQTKIREETALGMIYGGFGSVAANRNLEDTVMKGEKTLLGIKKEAITADTEIQNAVIDLNDSYSTDLQKIDQWKAEQANDNYSELQKYIMEVEGNKLMANEERSSTISNAITQYNTKIAEINASSATLKYNLAQALISRADSLKQQMFQNNETIRKGKVDESRETLGLISQTYAGTNYDSLPQATKDQISQLEKDAGLPSGFAKDTMKAAVSSSAVAKGTPGAVATGGRSGSPEEALNVPDGSIGGQCGHFVNQYTGLGVGDSYQSKMDKMDPEITTPEAGMVFTMPYGETGHMGFILSVEGDMATVKDSNYGLNEKVQTHQIPISLMTGFARTSASSESSSAVPDVVSQLVGQYASGDLTESQALSRLGNLITDKDQLKEYKKIFTEEILKKPELNPDLEPQIKTAYTFGEGTQLSPEEQRKQATESSKSTTSSKGREL